MKTITSVALAIGLASCLMGCDQPASSTQSVGQPAQGGSKPEAGQPNVPAVVLDKLLTRRNFYVVFDGSGSMNENRCAGNSRKINVAKIAAKQFERNLKPGDNLALLVFDGNGLSERVPLSNGDRSGFEQAVDAIDVGGGTPLYQSIGIAFSSLSKQMEKQLSYGEYHLVVITDGEASDSDGGIVAAINRTPIVIHTIGFCIGQGHSLNQPGKTYYADAQSPEQVKQGFEAVLAESDRFNDK